MLTNNQITTLLDQDWIVEICGDMGIKSKDRLTYPVKYFVKDDALYICDSIDNAINCRTDKRFATLRSAFSLIHFWETERKLYTDPSGTKGKLYRNKWERVLFQRYMFHKMCGRSIDFPEPTPQETDVPVQETDAPVQETDAPVQETDAPAESSAAQTVIETTTVETTVVATEVPEAPPAPPALEVPTVAPAPRETTETTAETTASTTQSAPAETATPPN